MAPREKFPTETEVQQLEQIDSLLTLRALYTHGVYHEDNPEHKRQEFIRWLYLQGRLES